MSLCWGNGRRGEKSKIEKNDKLCFEDGRLERQVRSKSVFSPLLLFGAISTQFFLSSLSLFFCCPYPPCFYFCIQTSFFLSLQVVKNKSRKKAKINKLNYFFIFLLFCRGAFCSKGRWKGGSGRATRFAHTLKGASGQSPWRCTKLVSFCRGLYSFFFGD